MKFFLIKTFGFILPLFLVLFGLECSYASIESDYSYKSAYLEKTSDTVKNLILGSSHAYYGINPEHFQEQSFNLAHVSQSLDLDVYLLEKFKRNTNCENIIIPISYFSFNHSLLDSKESWRLTNYHYYYGLEDVKTKDKFFLATHKNGFISTLIKAVFNSSSTRRYVDDNGFAEAQHDASKVSVENAERAIERHSAPELILQDNHSNNEQLKSLEACISQNQDLHFVLVTLPVHRFYIERRDERQLDYIDKCIGLITSRFKNVEYINLDSMALPDTCFKDSDHLSIHGARVVTQVLDSLLGKPTNMSADGF